MFDIKELAHLNPVHIETTEVYTIYQIELKANQVKDYLGYSFKWDESIIEPNLDSLKELLLEKESRNFISVNDIYNSKVISNENRGDIGWLIPILELGSEYDFDLDSNESVIVHNHSVVRLDHRRGIVISSILYGGLEVAAVFRAGRELRDEENIVVTNVFEYKRMIRYLLSLQKEMDIPFQIVNRTTKLKSLSSFYNIYVGNLLSKE